MPTYKSTIKSLGRVTSHQHYLRKTLLKKDRDFAVRYFANSNKAIKSKIVKMLLFSEMLWDDTSYDLPPILKLIFLMKASHDCVVKETLALRRKILYSVITTCIVILHHLLCFLFLIFVYCPSYAKECN